MEQDDRRPSPEKILAEIQEKERGKLTVFLGAMAGVGKTYAMLESAHQRLEDGRDVVIGWVETHGRKETESLAKGISTIPPKEIIYRGKPFKEMDLDAIIKRRPEIVLVDELAHTNVPGSRHRRRYQDVEEILAAGISVYTTLNVQHLESLNDAVHRITGVRVRETVPDRLLERADQVQLVDIPPEELLERLREGKVYVPHEAQRAIKRFFRPGNISALRELALRNAANRVQNQVEDYMHVHGIRGPWPAGEKILACVSPSPFSAQVIRTAKRMASSLKAPWIAVHVKTAPLKDETAKSQLAKNLHLAEELGAEILTLTSDDAVKEIVHLVRDRNITQIVIGKPLRLRISEYFRGSFVDRIILGSEGISVHVIPGKPEKTRAQKRKQQKSHEKEGYLARDLNPSISKSYLRYPGILILVATVTVINMLLRAYAAFDLINIALFYLLPVLFAATRWGHGPTILASVLGVLAFDFFFVPPTLTFSVQDIRYVASFLVLLAVGITTGTMATHLKSQAEIAQREERRTAALYSLSQKIAAERDVNGVLKAVVEKIRETLGLDAVILIPRHFFGDDLGETLIAEKPHGLEFEAETQTQEESGTMLKLGSSALLGSDFWIDDKERSVATWCFVHGEPAGKNTDTLEGAKGLYLPLEAQGSIMGVLGVNQEGQENMVPEKRCLLEAFANLSSAAILRHRLWLESLKTKYLEESEKLRTALFNSISHDLRTPLASITGAVTSLLEDDQVYDEDCRKELLQAIKQGAEEMNSFVANLLDMARLESGSLHLKKEWCDIQDIIGVALNCLKNSLAGRPVSVSVSDHLSLVKVDLPLIKEVLVNILENAIKYSDTGSPIDLSATIFQENGQECIKVSCADRGPGIAEADRKRIFDKFYRVKSPKKVTGTGLGLAISKGIVEAHGGRIWVEARAGGGSVFSFTLPLSKEGPGQLEPSLEKVEKEGANLK